MYDTYSKDVGVLIALFDNGTDLEEHGFYLWVWEMYWIHENHQYYSEDGLLNMIISERMLHFGNVKKQKI